MKYFFVSVTAFCVLGLNSVMANEEKCMYSFDPKNLQVEWQAYKTSDKLPVNGKFQNIKMKMPRRRASSLKALLGGAKAEVELASVESGNAERDQTLKMAFFKKFLKGIAARAKGTVISTRVPGKITLLLEMNGKKRPVVLDEEGSSPSEWVARGKIDILDWGLTGAWESLHQACETLHRGQDGVSKTWSEVQITLRMPFVKNCQPGV